MDAVEALFGAFALPFMNRALIVLLALSVVSGILAVLINLRGLEFVSDGLTHAVFPGLAVGAVLGGHEAMLGAALIAALTASVVLTVVQHAGVASDTAIAIVLVATFSVGVLIVSSGPGATSQLESLLFGRLFTMASAEVVPLIVLCVAALAAVLITVKYQVFRAFDPDGIRSSGQRILGLDLILNGAIAIVVVAAASAIGTLLVLALLIVPGAVARLASQRLWLLFPLAVGFAVLASWLGLSAGFAISVGGGIDVPGGATVAATFVVGYACVLLIRIARDARRRGRAKTAGASNTLVDSAERRAGLVVR